MAENRLVEALDAVRRRVLAIGVAGGTGWGLSAALAFLLLFAWADLALDLPPGLRAFSDALALAIGVALLVRAAMLAFRGSSQRSVARRIDNVSNSGGQILSGIDLLHQYGSGAYGGAGVSAPSLSGALAGLAIERAAQIAARVRAASAVPTRPLVWPYATVGVIGIAIGIIALSAPRLLSAQWLRFADPYGNHPPYAAIDFDVTPGDTRVIYGSALDVRAMPRGGAVDHVQLTFTAGDSQAGESLPMFPEPGGAWRATVSQVTAGGKYYVHAPGARSRQFQFDVITVPELRDVRVRISPPAYTHLPPYEGPVPERGIVGLAGTRVELWARSNRPLSGGTIEFQPGASPDTRPSAPPAPVKLMPTAAGADEVLGWFSIAVPGRLQLTIVDTEAQPSREPFNVSVTVVKDERPFVRILDPRPQSFATPDARLSVNMLAEDDYGISRLQLFRGLNDSSAVPLEIPVPPSQPTRLPASIPLNLAEYGLTPGDVVKLYARVEDNDPAGAKGSESPVVTVRIISNEDFNRMLLAREGLETLEAKYAMAARRLEALDNQIAKLQEKLKKLPPDSPLAKDTRAELKKLAKDLKDSADQVAEAAKQELPFDIDKKFRKDLDDVASSMREAAKATDELAGDPDLSSGKTDKKLGQIRQKLGGQRQQFNKQVTKPLENLDKIFPLIEDQARYVDLWQRQQDLAERMKSLINARPDDPRVKARMRDLETEQHGLQDDLKQLLNDISRHALQLPVDIGQMVRGERGTAFGSEAQARRGFQPVVPVVRDVGWYSSRSARAKRSFDGGTAVRFALADSSRVRTDVAEYRDHGLEASSSLSLRVEARATVLVADPAPGEHQDTLEQLRSSAFDFIRRVRKSGASEQMSDSAAGLGEFDGPRAAAKAQEAADTLKKFIDLSKAMSGKGQQLGDLVFDPSLSQMMRDTMDQLLAAEGLDGSKPGSGKGGSGGFSQRRSSLRNMGLYGRTPSRANAAGSRAGRSAAGPGGAGSADAGHEGDPGGQPALGKLQASGESGVEVPPAYKQKVGEYFQRVADELGED